MEKMVLSEYYESLKKADKIMFRDLVLDKTGISLPAFYDKRRNGKWSKSERFIIALILDKNEEDITFN